MLAIVQNCCTSYKVRDINQIYFLTVISKLSKEFISWREIPSFLLLLLPGYQTWSISNIHFGKAHIISFDFMKTVWWRLLHSVSYIWRFMLLQLPSQSALPTNLPHTAVNGVIVSRKLHKLFLTMGAESRNAPKHWSSFPLRWLVSIKSE